MKSIYFALIRNEADEPEFLYYTATSNELITENSVTQGERQNINLRKGKILDTWVERQKSQRWTQKFGG